ncbi:hypothetical protein Lal_00026120 [Lupinus albus]|nr:hypothetical protein Lal_00026120 [Lupinus albus]
MKAQLQPIQAQVEELKLKFERKPPKREAKIKVPSFIGKNNPEAYLKWEIKMEKVFDCNFYNEEKKVLKVNSEFKENALSWWVQVQKERSRYGLDPINTWERLKIAMRFRYAPKAYHQIDHNKMSQIIEDLKRALKDESTRRKREAKKNSTKNINNACNGAKIFINELTLNEYVESWSERSEKIVFDPQDENVYVLGPKHFKNIIFYPGDGDESIHYVNKVKLKRIVLDPRGDDHLNLRSNSLQEGGDDKNPRGGGGNPTF